MVAVETTGTSRILVDLHQNQTNSSRLVCVNTLFKGIVHLERSAILPMVNTNCDSFQTKMTGMGTTRKYNRIFVSKMLSSTLKLSKMEGSQSRRTASIST